MASIRQALSGWLLKQVLGVQEVRGYWLDRRMQTWSAAALGPVRRPLLAAASLIARLTSQKLPICIIPLPQQRIHALQTQAANMALSFPEHRPSCKPSMSRDM